LDTYDNDVIQSNSNIKHLNIIIRADYRPTEKLDGLYALKGIDSI